MKKTFNDLEIKYFAVGPLETNCIIIADTLTAKACVVDPGDEPHIISAELASENWQMESIVLTHGHYDHIGAVDELFKEMNPAVYIHAKDEPMLRDSMKNLSSFLGFEYTVSAPVSNLEQGQILQIGQTEVTVIEIPGHSPGSIGLAGEGFAVVGDTLFASSIGRTDFPFGSHEQLIQSISEKILTLQPHTYIYPGHGPSTTVIEEKHGNPFLD